MAFSLKENEEEARGRLRAFWAGTSLGRPALSVTTDNPEFEDTPWPGAELSPKQRDTSPEWHAWACDQALRSTVYLAEAMPSATVCWGGHLVTVAVLAGGDYEHNENSAWIQEIPDLYERPVPSFDPEQPAARCMAACLRKVAEAVGERGFVNAAVMLDAMTVLSLFREPGRLCMELLERPDDVRRWTDALTAIYIEAYEYFYRLVCDLGYGDTCTWLGIMAEGKMEAVQCDFSVMLSPEMYEQFVLSDLRRVTDYMDFSLYHLDGTCQMRFLDQLASLPKLNGIQWNPEPLAGSPVKWLDAMRRIRERGLSLFVSCSVDEAVEITRALGPDGLYFSLPRFKNRADAEEAILTIERVC